MRSPKVYSAGDEQTLGAKLRAPGDEWSLPSDAKIQGPKEDQEPLGLQRPAGFFKLDSMMQMMACLSN